MHFLKVEFLKFQNCSDINYPSERGEINCVDISKDSTTDNSSMMPNLKKRE